MSDFEEAPPDNYSILTFLFQNGDFLNIAIEVSTVIVNIFHLFILFQKELRSNSIFVILIGICIADILGFTVIVTNIGVDRHWYKNDINGLRLADVDFLLCLPTGYKVLSPIGTLKVLVIYSSRPISICLAILMALIRSLTIIFPLSNSITKLSKPRYAILMVIIVCAFWIAYYSWELVFVKYWWFPDHIDVDCYAPKKALSYAIHIFVLSWDYFYFTESRDANEYFVRLIPALFYPILTASLLIQLWRIQKTRKTRNPKKDNTTPLILFMTISFMLSEGLAGVSNFIESTNWPSYTAASYASAFTEVFNNLRSFNALSHFFVCVLMSSQYRDTVKRLFCRCKSRNKKEKKVIMVKDVYSRQIKSFNIINSRSF